MNPTLRGLGSPGAVLALLACGHALADFVLQSRAGVERKRRHAGAFAAHIATVFSVHVALLLPYLSPQMLGVVAALAVAHGAVDAGKILWERFRPGSPAAFVTDQALHALTLLAAAWAWTWLDGGAWVPGSWWWEPRVVKPAVLVAVLAFNGTGAGALVERVLAQFDLPRETPGDAMGRTIGMLERWLAVLLIWAGQWGALGLILAAKSIARFKDLERRSFSEYYLIGTLSSVLVAMVTALVARKLAG